MSVFCLRVCGTLCVWYLQIPEKGVKSPGNGATGSYEHHCGCWELDLGSLEVRKHSLLLRHLELYSLCSARPWYTSHKLLRSVLSWECNPSPWHLSQPPGLGVALVWTANPMPGPDSSPGEGQYHSYVVFKWTPRGGTCGFVFACVPCFPVSPPCSVTWECCI